MIDKQTYQSIDDFLMEEFAKKPNEPLKIIKEHIKDGYIQNSNSLILTKEGRQYLSELKLLSKESKKFWISVIISICSLIISVISLLRQ